MDRNRPYDPGHLLREIELIKAFRRRRPKVPQAPASTRRFTATCRGWPKFFHLVMDTIDRLPQTGEKGCDLNVQLKAKLVEHRRYIEKHGQDMPEMRGKLFRFLSKTCSKRMGVSMKKARIGVLM